VDVANDGPHRLVRAHRRHHPQPARDRSLMAAHPAACDNFAALSTPHFWDTVRCESSPSRGEAPHPPSNVIRGDAIRG
jgi:hypothetical protein